MSADGDIKGKDTERTPHGASADSIGTDEVDRPTPSNMRTLMVLEAVARAGAPITPTQANAVMGLPKPTIHRLFTSLEEEGFLRREIEGRHYSPGPRLARMAVETIAASRIRGARIAVMENLARRIGETINVAIPDGTSMVYLDRVETQWPLRIQLPVGTKVPLHATASGKMYLASLEPARLDRYLRNLTLDPFTEATITDRARLSSEVATTRERGHARDDEEFMEGMIALAVPILDRQAQLFGTLSFHAPRPRMDLEAAMEHLDALERGARELSRLAHGTLDAETP